MGRGETQSLKAIDGVDRFQELHERTFFVAAVYDRRGPKRAAISAVIDRRYSGEFMATVQIHDLAEERDFLHSASHELANLAHDLRDASAALGSARARHNAKCAVHIAALHDGNEGRGLLILEFVIPDRFLRSGFFGNIDNGKANVVHCAIRRRARRSRPTILSRDEFLHIISDAMKFLRPDNEVDVRQTA